MPAGRCLVRTHSRRGWATLPTTGQGTFHAPARTRRRTRRRRNQPNPLSNSQTGRCLSRTSEQLSTRRSTSRGRTRLRHRVRRSTNPCPMRTPSCSRCETLPMEQRPRRWSVAICRRTRPGGTNRAKQQAPSILSSRRGRAPKRHRGRNPKMRQTVVTSMQMNSRRCSEPAQPASTSTTTRRRYSQRANEPSETICEGPLAPVRHRRSPSFEVLDHRSTFLGPQSWSRCLGAHMSIGFRPIRADRQAASSVRLAGAGRLGQIPRTHPGCSSDCQA